MSGERAWPPADLLLARRPQVTPGLRSSTSRPPNPSRFSSGRSSTSCHQSHQPTQACLTECLSHTTTPTTTSRGDGTGLYTDASTCGYGHLARIKRIERSAARRPEKPHLTACKENAKRLQLMFNLTAHCCSTMPACPSPKPSSQRAQHPQRRQRAQHTRQRPA